MSALTIAGAYQLDQVAIPWPEWLRHVAARAGPSPGMLLLVVVFTLGAVVAAVVPLRETQLLLFNTSDRLEVRPPPVCCSHPRVLQSAPPPQRTPHCPAERPLPPVVTAVGSILR